MVEGVWEVTVVLWGLEFHFAARVASAQQVINEVAYGLPSPRPKGLPNSQALGG